MKPRTREVGLLQAKSGDGDVCALPTLDDIKEIYIPKSRIKTQF